MPRTHIAAPQASKEQGFSLVELSVALVIIGLLVGGIMGGRHLIQSATHLRMMEEVKTYKDAIAHFHEKYSSLPGDMPNATSYWSDCVNGGAGNTCNGTGNHHITGMGTGRFESVRAWQHLALAGLIEGEFDPTTATVDSAYAGMARGSGISEESVPKSAYSEQAAYMLGWVETTAAAFEYMELKDVLYVASLESGTMEALFTPEQAFLLDRKFDDGKPRTGKIFSTVQWTTSPPLCSAGSNVYQLSEDDVACVLIFERPI